jgi:hypothetical protein
MRVELVSFGVAGRRCSALLLVGLGGISAGCGTSETDETDDLPVVEPICDGTTNVRLVYVAIRGFGNYGSNFTDRYGSTYLTVDGTCTYWAGSDTLNGLRFGVLSADTANELSNELHFGRYSTAAGYRDPYPCSDAGPAFLRDSTGTISSSFCGIENAPRVVREAFARGSSLAQELGAAGEADWRRSTLLALRQPAMFPDVPTMRLASDWSSTLDLDTRAVTFRDLVRGLDVDAGLIVEDEESQALLGRLRQEELRKDPYAYDLLVRDAQDRYFQLLVRDEPPDAVAAAVLSLLASE